MRKWMWLIGLGLLGLIGAVSAQDTSSVPDVRGLSVPQARVLLNNAGYTLGTTTATAWSASAGEPNTIQSQSLAGDDNRRVDVIVLREFNVELRYNGNVFHMINEIEQNLPLLRVRLVRDDGRAAIDATRWRDVLEEQRCVQVWSVLARNFLKPDGCLFVQERGFFTSRAEDDHFWLGDDGQFYVEQDGIRRATCPVVPADADNFTRCSIYIAPGMPVPEDTTEYAYFLYDRHHWYAINRSESQWFPLGRVRLGVDFMVTDPDRFDDTPLDDLSLLAPGQCVQYTDGTPLPEDAEPLTDCTEIATATIAEDAIFWRRGFTVGSVVLDEERRCPPVVADERMLCLLPR